MEAESRCAMIEAEVREQVLREMTEQLNVIEATHRSALEREVNVFLVISFIIVCSICVVWLIKGASVDSGTQ